MKMTIPSKKIVRNHSLKLKKEKIGKETISYIQERADAFEVLGTLEPYRVGVEIYKWNKKQLASGKVIAIVLRGPDSIAKVKDLVGPTYPSKAFAGTIRGSYSIDTVLLSGLEKRAIHNVVHRSSSMDEAEREISLWFKQKIS